MSVLTEEEVIQPVKSLKLESTNLTVMIGRDEALATVQIVPLISPEDATYQNCLFTSSDESIATVSDDGTVKGIAPGKVKITVTPAEPGSKLKAVCNVTVGSLVTGISMKTSVNLKQKGSLNLKPEISPAKPTNGKLSWTSSDPEVATVSANGSVKAVSSGTAIITCTSTDGGEVSASCMVTVCIPVDNSVFRDSVFCQYVAENLDPDHDGLLTPDEINAVTKIESEGDIFDKNTPAIKDLSGIEYFRNLKELNVSKNRLTKLDLQQNINLEVLFCDYNVLKSIDFSYLPELKVLHVGAFPLRDRNGG